MDANSIDPGADEAVQRIQNSLHRIDTRAESHKAAQANPDALEGLLGELATSAHLGMQTSELYKRLAEKDHVTGVLSEAIHDMIAIASTTASVLREKHDLSVDRPGYKLLKALAWHYEELSEEAKMLNDPNWSSRGVWEIERILREGKQHTDPNGALRGTPHIAETEVAKAERDARAATAIDQGVDAHSESAAGQGNKNVSSTNESEETVTTNTETAEDDDEDAPYDPDGNWVKYLTPEQLEAAEAHAKKTAPAPQPVIEDEWKMQNRGGW